jgi:aspartokinase
MEKKFLRSIRIMRKVVKFGGSSLANAEQFEKVGDIIRSEESRRFVVPSAPGKRFDGDTKVTDLLYSCILPWRSFPENSISPRR